MENTNTTFDSSPATPAPRDIEMAQQIAPHPRYFWKRVLFAAAFIICISLTVALIPVVFKVDRAHTNQKMVTASVGLFVTYTCFCAPIVSVIIYRGANVDPRRSIYVRALEASFYVIELLSLLMLLMAIFPHVKYVIGCVLCCGIVILIVAFIFIFNGCGFRVLRVVD